MNKKFITFGGGGQKYIDASNRLINQINNTKLFDDTKFYNDNYLKNDKQFWNKHGTFILNNKRGYGYWLWKPYIIKKTMEEMKNDDILLYLDCGCEMEYKKKDTLKKYFDYVKNDKIIGCKTQIEKNWNKMDLVLHLDCNKKDIMDSPQHEAGAILFLVCNETRELVNKWYKTVCNYHYIDDSPSISKNINEFKEHRHDQSIFSLLTKKYKLFSDKSLHNCINYSRNKSGISQIKEHFTSNINNYNTNNYQYYNLKNKLVILIILFLILILILILKKLYTI